MKAYVTFIHRKTFYVDFENEEELMEWAQTNAGDEARDSASEFEVKIVSESEDFDENIDIERRSK